MLAAEWRPSKQQHYWKRPEYWKESWRLEETCCHSNSSEKPSVGADVKNSKGVNNNNNNNDDNYGDDVINNKNDEDSKKWKKETKSDE